jgi:hypothetical protein
VKGKYLELRLEKSEVLLRLEEECGEENIQDIINNPTLKLDTADLQGIVNNPTLKLDTADLQGTYYQQS